MPYPSELKYTKDHEWVRISGDTAEVGITDYAQEQLGDVVFVELPSPGTTVTAGTAFGNIESVKAVSELFAPLSGEIVAVNDRLTQAPEDVNKRPHDDVDRPDPPAGRRAGRPPRQRPVRGAPHLVSAPSDTASFARRHIGPSPAEREAMLRVVGAPSLDALADEIIPPAIRLEAPLALPPAETEHGYLRRLGAIASRNRAFRSYIGLGYHDTVTPAVIRRMIFENPGWYTPYTPYQSEIAQGRLEALLTFQTMVSELTAMEVANASLLDEATGGGRGDGAAPARAQGTRDRRSAGAPRRRQLRPADDCRDARPRRTAGHHGAGGGDRRVQLRAGSVRRAGAVAGHPWRAPRSGPRHRTRARRRCGRRGRCRSAVAGAGEASGRTGCRRGLRQRPALRGAARYGGPHAGFFATRQAFVRHMPGRLIGVSVDAHGQPAYRMALATREQHIRREKATSNICTAQALLASMAAMYAVYHGPEGLRAIARRIHDQARALEASLGALGYRQRNAAYFDTLSVAMPDGVDALRERALRAGINFHYAGAGEVRIALDETVADADLEDIVAVFAGAAASTPRAAAGDLPVRIPAALERTTPFLTHGVFNTHRSETQMMRFLRRLERKDLGLDTSMIPLGSCTMKLNAAAQLIPVTWEHFGRVHPFAPADQAEGYHQVFQELSTALCAITGFAGVSLQPNSGAQGEFAGLLAIRAYHRSRGDDRRTVVLIPASAHGTNPASAVLAGFRVVVVANAADGGVDLADLKRKADEHADTLACLMITYPSTHGVFEAGVRDVCALVHEHGGQVYMDGANMNAQVGLTSPARIGADVCHLNLHKTFAIPHGGGGPGMGPIAVASHLVPFLPGHPLADVGGPAAIAPVSAAPWGSASILLVSHAYVCLLGADGMTAATQVALLNANYIKSRLEPHYPVLYAGATDGWRTS